MCSEDSIKILVERDGIICEQCTTNIQYTGQDGPPPTYCRMLRRTVRSFTI